MSELKPYKHEGTGKVGHYSDAVAKLFPSLKPVSDESPDAPKKTRGAKSAPKDDEGKVAE